MSCITLSHNRHSCLPACCGRRAASQSGTRYPRCLAQGLPGSSRGSRTRATPLAPLFGWSRLLPGRRRTADPGLQTASCTHTHTHTHTHTQSTTWVKGWVHPMMKIQLLSTLPHANCTAGEQTLHFHSKTVKRCSVLVNNYRRLSKSLEAWREQQHLIRWCMIVHVQYILACMHNSFSLAATVMVSALNRLLMELFQSHLGSQGPQKTLVAIWSNFKSPSTSVFLNPAMLFCCNTPEIYCGIQNFIWLSMGMRVRDNDWILISLGELIL